MATEFKVGDKVRRIDGPRKGLMGTITSLAPAQYGPNIHNDYWVRINGETDGLGYYCYERVREPIAHAQDEEHLADVSNQQHYSRFAIQPIVFIRENNLPFWAGNVIKYVCRHDAKDGLKDLRKARDYLDKEIKLQEGVNKWWD